MDKKSEGALVKEVRRLRKELAMHVAQDVEVIGALRAEQEKLRLRQELHHEQNTCKLDEQGTKLDHQGVKLDSLTVVNAEQLAAIKMIANARRASISAYKFLMWALGTATAVLAFLGLYNRYRG